MTSILGWIRAKPMWRMAWRWRQWRRFLGTSPASSPLPPPVAPGGPSTRSLSPTKTKATSPPPVALYSRPCRCRWLWGPPAPLPPAPGAPQTPCRTPPTPARRPSRRRSRLAAARPAALPDWTARRRPGGLTRPPARRPPRRCLLPTDASAQVRAWGGGGLLPCSPLCMLLSPACIPAVACMPPSVIAADGLV